MYNGIGLTTPRGTGTSGHVVKNVSYIRPEFFRNKIDANTGKHNSYDSHGFTSSAGNKEILDHNKKREIESKLFELQETMIEQGYTDVEVEEKVAEARKSYGRDRSSAPSKSSKPSNDSHVRETLKKEENQRIRSAFGIKSNFVEGDSFNEEAIAAEKNQRNIEREERDKKREDDRRGAGKFDDRRTETDRGHKDSDRGDERDRRDGGDRGDRGERRGRNGDRVDRRSRSRSRGRGRDSSRRTRS